MRRPVIALAVLFLLAAAPAVFDVGPASQAYAASPSKVYDPGQKGPFEIGFTSFLLIDEARDGDGGMYPHRPIPVYVWYPVDPQMIAAGSPEAVYPLDPLYEVVADSVSSDWENYGLDRAYQEAAVSSARPFPLLLFSPGWGGPAWIHTSVGTRLASHGFVVAVAYHYGDQWWPWEPPYDHLAVASYNRPRDISFVLDDLLVKNSQPGHLLKGAIRPTQVAAGGWSLGGYAAMTLAGGDDSVCDLVYDMFPEDLPVWTCVPTPPDQRIRAIVPQDGSNQLLHFYELARISVPAMGLGEEWSMLALDPPWDSWQARQHAAFSGRPAYRVDVFNTIHQSFSDLCEGYQVLGDLGIVDPGDVAWVLENLCEPFTPTDEVHSVVNQYTIAFLKTNLAREPGYQNMLTPGWALTREQYIEFFVTEKKSPNSIDQDWPDLFIYFKHQSGSEQARAEKDPKGKLELSRPLHKR